MVCCCATCSFISISFNEALTETLHQCSSTTSQRIPIFIIVWAPSYSLRTRGQRWPWRTQWNFPEALSISSQCHRSATILTRKFVKRFAFHLFSSEDLLLHCSFLLPPPEYILLNSILQVLPLLYVGLIGGDVPDLVQLIVNESRRGLIRLVIIFSWLRLF